VAADSTPALLQGRCASEWLPDESSNEIMIGSGVIKGTNRDGGINMSNRDMVWVTGGHWVFLDHRCIQLCSFSICGARVLIHVTIGHAIETVSMD
jgi:hypothetical protein